MDKVFDSFPNITFTFENNVKFKWMARNYFDKSEEDSLPGYCISIGEINSRVILGAPFMRNHDIYFDQSNQKIRFV